MKKNLEQICGNLDIITKKSDYNPLHTDPKQKKLHDLIKGKGYYAKYNIDQRARIWNRWKQMTYVGVIFNLNAKGADCSRFNFSGVVFKGKTSFENANLEKANLEYANLKNANLKNVNLMSACLPHAILYQANLEYANLRYANFYGVNLAGANLMGADFEYTIIWDATFAGVNLKDIKNLDKATHLDKARNLKC